MPNMLANSTASLDSKVSQRSEGTTVSRDRARLFEIMQSVYPVQHQVAYLDLHTEADLLLQQLQTLKQQRDIVSLSTR
jgi:hypothetical protein